MNPKPHKSTSAGQRLSLELCARIHRQVEDPGPAGGLSYLSEAEYAASIGAALAQAPHVDGMPVPDIWIFAYGSLIWNPGFAWIERRIGSVKGWHRSFCLKSTRWRGSPDKPGLMMALEPGGQCQGLVYRLSPANRDDDLNRLWRRELGVKPVNHHPRWIQVRTDQGSVRALAFTANRGGQSYRRPASLEDTAAIIAGAVGVWGPCAAYLCETVTHLEAWGIRDRHLWRLQALVAQIIAADTDGRRRSRSAKVSMDFIPMGNRA